MNKASSLYGKSLYDLAKEEHLEKEILEEMSCVKTLLEENPDYYSLLQSLPFPRRRDCLFWIKPLQQNCSLIY